MLGVQLLSVTGKAESSQNIPVNPASNYLEQNTLCSPFSCIYVPCTQIKNNSRTEFPLYALLKSCSVNRIILEIGYRRGTRKDTQIRTFLFMKKLANQPSGFCYFCLTSAASTAPI